MQKLRDAKGLVLKTPSNSGVTVVLPSVAEFVPKPDGIENFHRKARALITHRNIIGVSITAWIMSLRCWTWRSTSLQVTMGSEGRDDNVRTSSL